MKTFLVVLFPALLAGQSVRLIPDLAVAESEYRDAQQDWLKNDPNLEQDLFSKSREEMRGRIRRAAGLRDEVMAKKEVYLTFLVKRFDELKTRLTDTKGANIPTDQLKKDLEREQTRLLAEQERLESLIHELPEGDEYSLVRRSLQIERNDLVGLQNNVALRIRSLDKMDVAQKAAQADPLEQKLDELKKLWEGERARAVRGRSAWARYYADMEQALDNKNGRSPDAGSRPVHPLASKTAPPASSPAVTRKNLEGSWAYRSQPGAWVGFGEPESVVLELHKSGGSLEGSYIARLPGRGDVRRVSLTLQGRFTAGPQAKIQWNSQRPPAHGEISLKLASDGRLLVERLTSDDSYIPLGSEVLLPQVP